MDNSQPASKTSPSLLLRIRNPDDQESWRTFERVYGIIIRSYCRHWKLQTVDTEDVTQEVFAAVAKQIQTFEYDPKKGRFRAWLGTITANKIKRFILRKSKRRETQLPTDSTTNEFTRVYSDPDHSWVTIFSIQILEEACRNVRPDFADTTWRCFEATWIEQKPPADVATSLEISIHAVYVNKSRVMKRLKQEIVELADDVPYDLSSPN